MDWFLYDIDLRHERVNKERLLRLLPPITAPPPSHARAYSNHLLGT